MRLAPGTILRDKYQIVRKVGDGEGPQAAGTDGGEVFEARHLDLAGRYAIKFLCEGGIRNAVLLDELRREALATASIGHPGLVRVFDLDQAPDGSPFVAMEYLVGQDLARLMRSGRPMALSDVAVIVEAIAAPLAEAHRRGIVHGDLTPSNVFVLDAEADPHARVKLLDFGVARIRAQAGGIVRNAGAAAEAAYLAPEQRQGRTWEVDERSDVFSLGAIAQALTTGRSPGAPASATGSTPVVPPGVAAAIARATSTHREGRFRTVTDFSRALRAAISPQAARASGARPTRPGSAAVRTLAAHNETERVRQPAGMRRLLAAAIGCGAAILVGAVIMTRVRPAPVPAPPPVAAPKVAVAPKPAPPPVAAPPPAPAPPPPAAPAPLAATDLARQPLPPRPTVPKKRRSAHADMTDEARREMEQSYKTASRAFDLGNYDEAIVAYKRTYELGGDAPMLYNIAQALRLAKRPEEAAGFYRRYLERAPKAPNRDEVLTKLASLPAAKPAPAEPPASATSLFSCHWPELAPAGKAIEVSCADPDPRSPVTKAVLLYRATGGTSYSPVELTKDGKGTFKGSVPVASVTAKGVEVYFEGRKTSGEMISQSGSATRPNSIAVTQ
jgi:serine/threonine-protein kinase